MEKSTSKNSRQISFELIAAIIMGILAVGCFIFQAITVNSETTQLETVLFNLLQFLLTIGFAWFSGREVSKSEFEKSLKQFAIGAYRRIADIDKMLRRLQREVGDMLVLNPENQENLQIVEAIVFDTCQVVQSSTDDWADVIGEELIAIEKIRRLEHQKNEIELLEKTTGTERLADERINEIEKKIDELRSSLPTQLNISSQESKADKFSPLIAAAWILEKHETEHGLVLRVVCGGVYSEGKKPQEINLKQELFISAKTKLRDGIDVVDADGHIFGRVLNFLPLKYLQFQSAMETCYNLDLLPVEFLEVADKYKKDGKDYIHFTVQVRGEPVYKKPIKKKRK